jgi:hypothetical protein
VPSGRVVVVTPLGCCVEVADRPVGNVLVCTRPDHRLSTRYEVVRPRAVVFCTVYVDAPEVVREKVLIAPTASVTVCTRPFGS